MKIQIDTHTHTVLSGHAHSTLLENAAAAAKNGLAGFVITEHGPALVGAPPEFNICTYPFLPTHIEDVRVYPGVEANVVSFDGEIDIRDAYLGNADYVIAGMHEVVIRSGGTKLDTQAAVGALENKHVDIIAHPDNPSYSLNYEVVVKEAAKQSKLMEVNSHSFEFRVGGMENARHYLALCRKHDVRVAVSSDAHFAAEMGKHDAALRLLYDIDFPPELIVNLTIERFEAYIKERKKRLAVLTNSLKSS